MDSRIRTKRWLVMALIVAVTGFAATARGAEPIEATVITTKKMCPTCARKIAEKLRKLDGAAEARADLESKSFVVLAIAGRELSPRVLWETVESGGEQPIRLTGPSGTFVAKPNF